MGTAWKAQMTPGRGALVASNGMPSPGEDGREAPGIMSWEIAIV